MTITPKLNYIKPDSGSIKDLRTNYILTKDRPLATFKYRKMPSFNQTPVTVDRHGKRLGFGNDLGYFSMNPDSARDGLVSRGTMLRMYSDTESNLNAQIADVRKVVRHSSQPIIPTTQQLAQSNLPRIINNAAINKPLDRLTTPGYVGPEAYNHFYEKYRRLTREKEISPQGYSASTAFLTK